MREKKEESEEELKPCPFCGSRGEFIDESDLQIIIGCENWVNCFKRGFNTITHGDNFKKFGIESWNKRTPEQTKQAE